jgi:hypothetical protein
VVGQVIWLLIIRLSGARDTKAGALVDDATTTVIIFAASLAVYGWADTRLAAAGQPPRPAVNLGASGNWLLLAAAAGAAALIWLWSKRVSGSRSAATFAWAAVCLTSPFVLNCLDVVAGSVMTFFTTLRHVPSISPRAIVSGAPGLLLDQEFGLFAYAPVLVLGIIGLAKMARARENVRLAAVLAAAVFVIVFLAAARDPWWSEAMPGRAILLALPLVAPPIAWLYSRLPPDSLSRAGAQVALLLSVAVTAIILLFIDHVPLPQEGDGSSSLLQWLSPTLQLWDEAPSFVVSPFATASLYAAVWLGMLAILAWICSRRWTASRGAAAAVATASTVAVLMTVLSLTSVLQPDPTKRFEPEGRVLFPLLETFDPHARPIAVRYNPLSRVQAEEVPPLFALSAVPRQRTNRQPVRVVLNARFRLPAGEYVVDFKGSEAAEPVPNAAIGLQIGRDGRPVQSWPLTIRPGEQVRFPFQVPLDAEFVGFRTARQVERAIDWLRVTPVSVVPKPRRFRTPTVRAASTFATATVFFHDGESYPEPGGFWVKGRSTASVTLLKANPSDGAITLALHGGPRPNAVTFSSARWSQQLDLVPGLTAKVEVPSKDGEAFVPLQVTAASGFVPAQVERSRDERLLGTWISFIRGDTSKTSATP